MSTLREATMRQGSEERTQKADTSRSQAIRRQYDLGMPLADWKLRALADGSQAPTLSAQLLAPLFVR